MSFPRYERYKDSGFEWLGVVPEHWEVTRVKRLATKIGSGKTPRGGSEVYVSNGVIFLRSQNVHDTGLRLDDVVYISPEMDEEMDNTRVQAGDILLNVTGASIGRTTIVPPSLGAANVSQHVCIIRIPNCDFRSFLALAMQGHAIRSQIGLAQNGAAREGLNFEQIGNIVFALPLSAMEFHAITNFLRHELQQIQVLIEEQCRLIDLLKEKRQAVISHAVTKGLGSNTPMRDSGVQWLGSLPRHWDVRNLKGIVSTPITDGPHSTPDLFDEGIPFVSAEAVSSGSINFEKVRGYISREDHETYARKYLPMRGDIYMIKSGATTGATAIVETDHEFNIWSPLAAIRCKEGVNPYFVLHYMRSRPFLDGVTLNWSFGTQQNIGMNVIENLAIPVPPLAEQVSIASYCSTQVKMTDRLLSSAQDAIALLQERRSALISAAITGKIDVRNYNPKEVA